MSSFLLFLALLSLSLIHACHGGRQIGGSVPRLYSDDSEDVANVKIDATSLGEKNPVQGIEGSFKKSGENQEAIQGKSGTEMSSSHVGLSAMTNKLKGKVFVTTEHRQSKKTDVEGDVLSMDYEPPHRKPPIHN